MCVENELIHTRREVSKKQPLENVSGLRGRWRRASECVLSCSGRAEGRGRLVPGGSFKPLELIIIKL